MTTSDNTRTVTLSFGVIDMLKGLARDQGRTIDEVLANAVALELWYHTVKAAGSRVFVEDCTGKVREVVKE